MAYPRNSADAVAQDQIKAFVERIMRMREEAKAINDDIREIYAEAKANGFDKTVLGKIVIHVERRSKDNAKMLEAQALFDLYLDAFDGATGTVVATHTHEPITEPAIAADQGGEESGTLDSLSADTIQSDDPTEPAGDSPNTVAGRPNSELHPAALNALKLRPHCLHADDLTQCAGVGKKHCGMCLAAHADAEGMSA